MEPVWGPGTRISYHPLSSGWILGEVVRRVDDHPIDRFMQEEVCRPLGITSPYFGVPPEEEHRMATLENAAAPGQIDLSLTPSLSNPAEVLRPFGNPARGDPRSRGGHERPFARPPLRNAGWRRSA